jgi:hypothetical protein
MSALVRDHINGLVRDQTDGLVRVKRSGPLIWLAVYQISRLVWLTANQIRPDIHQSEAIANQLGQA